MSIYNGNIEEITNKHKREYELMEAQGASEESLYKKRIQMYEEIATAYRSIDHYYLSQAEELRGYLQIPFGDGDAAAGIRRLNEYSIKIVELREELKNLSDDDPKKKDLEWEINKYNDLINIAEKYIDMQRKSDEAAEQEMNYSNKVEVEKEKWAKRNQEMAVNDIKNQIELNETKIEGYKWSKEGYELYMKYYNAQLQLYASDSKEYRNLINDKKKYQAEFVKQAKITEMEIFELGIKDLPLEEQLTKTLELMKKQHDEELANAKYTDEEKIKLEEEYQKRVIKTKADFAVRISKREEDNFKNEYNRNKEQNDLLLRLYENGQNEIQNVLEEKLANREISIQDYNKSTYELTLLNLKNQKDAMDKFYNEQQTNISGQITNLEDRLKIEGLDDETIKEIKSRLNDLYAYRAQLELDYNDFIINNRKQNREVEQNELIKETEDFNTYMNSLRQSTNDAINEILSTASVGISSKWGQAFDQLSQGFQEMMNNIKTGEKGWQGYAKAAGLAISSVGNIMNALAEQQDETTKEGFEKQKKFQIAAATMSMLAGILNATTSAMSNENAWMTIWGQIALAAATSAMVAGIGGAQIAAIKRQQFDGGSSSGSLNAGNVGSLMAPVQYTQDVQGGMLMDNIGDQKVVVLESDITNTQNKVQIMQSEAKF